MKKCEWQMENSIPKDFIPIHQISPFSKQIGVIYERSDDQGFVRAFHAAERHTNSGGVVHGGVLSTFADIVLAQAVFRELALTPITVRLVTEYLIPVKIGAWIEGTARLRRSGRSLAFVEGEVIVGRRMVVIASAVFKL